MVRRFRSETSSTADLPAGMLLHAAVHTASEANVSFLCGLGVIGALAVACDGTLPHPPYTPQPESSLVAVEAPPPPARAEYVPPQPSVRGAVWLDGEWTLKRGRWAWRAGRWLVPPADSVFSPWVFVRGVDGTPYVAPGVFRDRNGKAVDEPAPLAVGTPNTGAVVDADGLLAITGRSLHAPEVAAPPK